MCVCVCVCWHSCCKKREEGREDGGQEKEQEDEGPSVPVVTAVAGAARGGLKVLQLPGTGLPLRAADPCRAPQPASCHRSRCMRSLMGVLAILCSEVVLGRGTRQLVAVAVEAGQPISARLGAQQHRR
jgi:hypothetical protein